MSLASDTVCLQLGVILVFMSLRTNGLFDYFNGRVVVLNPKLLIWSDAAKECEGNNGTLLTISDVATMYDIGIEGRWIVWVGLKSNGRSFAWQSGLPVSWTHWASESIQDGDGEQCLSLETIEPFVWQFKNCTTKLPSLCEMSSDSTCEFTIRKHSSLIGFTDSLLIDKSLTSCRNACIHATDFDCQSFEFNEKRDFCQLSSKNRWMFPNIFASNDPEWDYHHMNCYQVDWNQSFIPNGYEETTVPFIIEEATEKFCFTVHDLTPTENETKEIEKTIEELQELSTKYKNRRRIMSKESVPDDRPSATYVGTIAMVFMASLIALVVILDLMTITQHTCKSQKRKKRKNRDVQLKSMARARAVLAEREMILSAHSPQVNGTACDSGGGCHDSSIVELESVHLQIPRPSTVAHCQNESATLQICRINNINKDTDSFCIGNKEQIVKESEAEMGTTEEYSYINSAYVNTSPVLSPFYRSQSEKATRSGVKRTQRHPTKRSFTKGHIGRSFSDSFTSYAMLGPSSSYTMWPFVGRNRRYFYDGQDLKGAGKHYNNNNNIMEHENESVKEERMETVKY